MKLLTRTQSASKKAENRTARWLAAPALALIGFFTIVPISLALTLGFTNAQLLSPTNPNFVGINNFKTLLGVSVVTLHAPKNADGSCTKDKSGAIAYEPLRPLTRDDSPRRDLRGKSEFKRLFANNKNCSIKVIVAGDPVFWRSLTNTFFFALIVVPVQAGLALLLALLVNQRLKGRNFFRTVYFIPTLSSMVVISMLWRFMYQQDGLINKSIANIVPGYIPIDWLGNPKTAMPAIIGLSIWQAVGYHMIIWLGGLQTIPAELYEAVRMDGATKWHEFRYVTIPGLRHTFVFILITITIAALGLFVQINVLTQGGPLDSTSTLVFQSFTHGYQRQEIGYGSAISFVFFVLVLIIALIQRSMTKRLDQ
jgi:multiple sugar transport system permease protein